MKQARLKIEGMRCEACAHTIKTLVEKEPGVKTVAVTFETGEARILYDPATVSEGRLVATVEKPGYRVVERE